MPVQTGIEKDLEFLPEGVAPLQRRVSAGFSRIKDPVVSEIISGNGELSAQLRWPQRLSRLARRLRVWLAVAVLAAKAGGAETGRCSGQAADPAGPCAV